ncbi:MAG: hypothetical protein AAFQ36_07590 [Pseudomonadota bacterium]
MVNLVSQSPLQGWSLTAGGVSAREVVFERVTSVQPFKGAALSLPAPGTWRAEGAGRMVWTGLDEWFAMDCDAPENTATTDQTDAWAWVDLGGEWAAVLARLCPVDPSHLTPGTCARSDVAHMSAILIATDEALQIGVMRSFAGSFTHALSEVMTSVAAQSAL